MSISSARLKRIVSDYKDLKMYGGNHMNHFYAYLGDLFSIGSCSPNNLHLTVVWHRDTCEVVFYGWGGSKTESLLKLNNIPEELKDDITPLPAPLNREWLFFEKFGIKNQVEDKLKEVAAYELGIDKKYVSSLEYKLVSAESGGLGGF